MTVAASSLNLVEALHFESGAAEFFGYPYSYYKKKVGDELDNGTRAIKELDCVKELL